MFRKSELDYMTSIPSMRNREEYHYNLNNPEALYLFQQSIGEGIPKHDFGDIAYMEKENIFFKPKKKIKRR